MLQLLTGLALAALALVVVVELPAASAGPAVVTAASPAEITPAGLAEPDATRAEHDDARGAAEPEISRGEAQPAATGHAAQVATAVLGVPEVVRQLTAGTGTAVTPPTGSTPASLGSRGPPLR